MKRPRSSLLLAAASQRGKKENPSLGTREIGVNKPELGGGAGQGWDQTFLQVLAFIRARIRTGEAGAHASGHTLGLRQCVQGSSGLYQPVSTHGAMQAWVGMFSDLPEGGGSLRADFVTLPERSGLSDSLVLPVGGGV